MHTQGINIGKLTDAEYCAAVVADEDVIAPLLSAQARIEEVLIFFEDNTIDNAVQKEYALIQAESLISKLKDITKYLEG